MKLLIGYHSALLYITPGMVDIEQKKWKYAEMFSTQRHVRKRAFENSDELTLLLEHRDVEIIMVV